jgi:prephenate dehydratase
MGQIAHLGPAGTYAEMVAAVWADHLSDRTQVNWQLCPYPTITQTLQAVLSEETQLAVVPVENSIQGSVTITLDSLWQMSVLQVQQALVLPISHALISHVSDRNAIEVVYSHPQALAQCQDWLETHLPNAKPMATNSTAEALQHLEPPALTAAIASERAAQLYGLPVLAHPINDHPDNCTRFWVMGLNGGTGGTHTSLAFSLPKNTPGALVNPLRIFADRTINMSRIESRPTKRSLGEYLFFIDIEADSRQPTVQTALKDLEQCTETLKIFGSYTVLSIDVTQDGIQLS